MGLSKELFLEISNEINDLIFILNPEFKIEFINEKVHSKLLGYSNEDLISKKIKNFIDTKDFRKLKNNIENIDHNGDNSIDIQIYHKDGKKLWFEGKNKLFDNDNGEKRILFISKDISERKQTELIVKESQEKYQSIIKTINEGYYEVDLKGNFTFVSDTLCKFIGYAQDELLGQSYEIVTDKKASKLIFKTFNKVFRSKIQKNLFQFPVIKKNGKKAFFETSVYLKNETNGKKLGFYGIVRDITERKKEEDLEEKFKIELAQTVRLRTKELRESEEKYSNIFQHSNDGIFFHDLDGNIIDANQKVLEQFGYDKNEILTLRVPQLHPISDLVESKKAFNQISKKGFVRFEINFKKKNGKIFPAEVSSSLFTIGGEKFIQGVVRDISTRKLSESKLKISEEKYRHLFQNSPFFVGLVDLNGVLIDCNDSIDNLLSVHTKEDIIGKNFREIFAINEKNNDVIPIFRTLYKNIIRGKATEPIEFKLNRTIGDYLWLNLRGSLMKIDDKSLIQFIIQDITEKKKAEQDLRESEEKYRYLFEDSPFSIILINSKGVIIDCNPAILLLGDYKKEDLIGIPFKDLKIIPQEFLLTLIDLFKRFIKGEILHQIDIQLYKKDGSLIWTNLQASLVNVGGETFVQVILHDITKRKGADLLIKEEIQKLKDLDQLRKDLISRVSHELKTPLVSVFASSEYLLSEYEDKLGKDVLELIQMIQKGGNRLKHLVDNLLDITRIEYNKFNLEKKAMNLSELILECSEELKYFISERNLDLDLNLPERLILNIDRIRIQQVITNLLLNAIKNTPPYGKIVVKLGKNEEWVEISMKDTGVGLTKEEMGILFTRFGKIERFGEGLEYIDIQGSGLGLFISKEIVHIHGGTISAESEGRHKGSIFIVKLPIN